MNIVIVYVLYVSIVLVHLVHELMFGLHPINHPLILVRSQLRLELAVI